MQQPPGLIDKKHPDYVCRLHKSLYGLKQAPRAWFSRLTTFLLTLHFHPSKADSSLFIYRQSGIIIYVLIYVDDILVTSNCSSQIQRIISSLGKEFAIKDLGLLHYFLGVEARTSSKGLFLSQRKYISDLLQKSGMSHSKPVQTPISTTAKLTVKSGTPMSDPSLYRQIVGSLQYLTLTRPDISFAVNKVCQYMHSPTEEHWQIVKRIL